MKLRQEMNISGIEQEDGNIQGFMEKPTEGERVLPRVPGSSRTQYLVLVLGGAGGPGKG